MKPINSQSTFAPRAFIAAGAMLATLVTTAVAQDASSPLPPPGAASTDSSLTPTGTPYGTPGATNTSGMPSRDSNSNTVAPATASPTLPASGASNTPASAMPDNRSGVLADSSVLNRSDRNFVMKAAKSNAHEVAISRVAAERATRPDVRAFAQEVIAAHQTMDTGLSRLAASKSVTLDPVDADITRKWSDKKAEDFDEDYVKEMVKAHKDSVDLYEENARDAKDTGVATFAREQIATLNAHLRKAQDLEKALD